MSKKYDEFIVALESLCREHKVQISVSHYDDIQIWDLGEGDEPIYAPDIEDRTDDGMD